MMEEMVLRQKLNWCRQVAMDWYENIAVKFEMVKIIRYHEFSMITPTWVGKEGASQFSIRNRKFDSIVSFEYHTRRYWFGDDYANAFKVYNLYYSAARYEHGVPICHTAEEAASWKENAWKEIKHYDLLIDIDAPDFKRVPYAHEAAMHIKTILDKYDVAHDIRYTGKGNHIIIPGTAISCQSYQPHTDSSAYEKAARVLEYFHDMSGEFIDYTIADSRRLMKIPYSLAFYKDDYAMCWPLTLKELNHFDCKKYMNENVHKFEKEIRDRGIIMFNKKNADDVEPFEEFYKNEVLKNGY